MKNGRLQIPDCPLSLFTVAHIFDGAGYPYVWRDDGADIFPGWGFQQYFVMKMHELVSLSVGSS